MATPHNKYKSRFGATVLALTTTGILAVVGMMAGTASAQEKTAGQAWPAAQQVSMDKIDHSSYDKLLQKYVDKNGMVAYKAWHASATDRQTLTNYLAHLSQASLNQPASREAQLAYWINAYNAVTLEGILRVYPTSSIKNHTKALGYNIWKNLLLHTGDRKLSLEDIEHKVLRKMNEPRIHFAIVCASIGCPRLLNRAYFPQTLGKQLVVNTQDFFSRSQNLQVSGNTLNMSKIMEWYGSDFAQSPQQQAQVLAKYFPQSAQQVVASGNFGVGYLGYDWNLNEGTTVNNGTTNGSSNGSSTSNGSNTASGSSTSNGSGTASGSSTSSGSANRN